MKEFIGMVEQGIKNFTAKIIEKSNLIIIALLLVQISLTVLNIRIDLEAYVHNINKTESRYKSTITALNYIHKTTMKAINPEIKGEEIKKIDDYAGEAERELTADEQIQRKKNHKKYLYHYIKDWFGKSGD